MAQIRIECPHCGVRGKLDGSTLPEGGGNIRCPGCRKVFFAGGPEDVLPDDDAPQAPAVPETSGEQAAEPEPAGPYQGAWRVKATSGMIYDFPDTSSMQTWLESRSSLDELQFSKVGTDAWGATSSFTELESVVARGLLARGRSSRITGEQRPTGPATIPSSIPSTQPMESGTPATTRPMTQDAPRRPTQKNEPVASKSAASSAASNSSLRLTVLLGVAALLIGGVFLLTRESDTTPKLPSTPAGDAVAWVIQKMNEPVGRMTEAEVESRMTEQVLNRVSAAGMIVGFQFWQEAYPGYTLHAIEPGSTRSKISVIVDTPAQDKGLIVVEVEESPPHRIQSLQIEPHR